MTMAGESSYRYSDSAGNGGGGGSRLLLLCPGQGGQHPQMFDLARNSPAGAALLERLQQRMPEGQLTGGADLNADSALYANRSAQPLIVAATLAMWEALRASAPRPALVAGYSIGELAAYGVAGAFMPDTAMELAALRAGLMDDSLHSDTGDTQALLAISGLPLARVQALLHKLPFYISIETGEDSCIAGGLAACVEPLQAEVAAAGGRSQRLPVEVASHTPLMQAAVAPFAAALLRADFHAMNAPVLAGVNAAEVRDQAMAAQLLSRQLAEKIRWMACMDACAEAGITLALELGPGAALSRMLTARHPHIDCRSVSDFRSLDGIRRWLDRAAG